MTGPLPGPLPGPRLSALAGTLRLAPGRPVPNIASTRTELAPRIARGRDGRSVPALLASVFTVCGSAHRAASQAAIAAAGGTAGPDPTATRRALQLDTLRDHLRRVWLDWPRLDAAGDGADLVPALACCPAMRVPLGATRTTASASASGGEAAAGDAGPGSDGRDREAIAAMPDWLEAHAVGGDPERWLARWQDDPEGWLATWSATGSTHPARWLARRRHDASLLAAPLHAATPHRDATRLDAIAARLRHPSGFALAPDLEGRPAETGAWTRINDGDALSRSDTGGRRGAPALWWRLGARFAELVRLSMPDRAHAQGADWLSHGARSTAAGEGLAWVETARGLLIHWVRTSSDRALDAPAAVADYRVIAPTDWSFHPTGVVAALLASPRARHDATRVGLIAAVFDPCVDIDIDRGEVSGHA